MGEKKPRPTIVELFEVLKRTTLPTVLVEGQDDIIFYRSIEDELQELEINMLPAGNKYAVLELHKMISQNPIPAPIVFVVDKDLWVHSPPDNLEAISEIITTTGYSIENDLFSDGDLETLLNPNEKNKFKSEIEKFSHWYSLSIHRSVNGKEATFRTHPGKVLDDTDFYSKETQLKENEEYPTDLHNEILSNYGCLLRGKSLFSILLRQLSEKKRDIKFSNKQLMAIGAARKGSNFQRLCYEISRSFKMN